MHYCSEIVAESILVHRSDELLPVCVTLPLPCARGSIHSQFVDFSFSKVAAILCLYLQK